MPVPSGFWWLATAYLTALDDDRSETEARNQTIERCLSDPQSAGLKEGEACEACVDAVIKHLALFPDEPASKEDIRFPKLQYLARGQHYDLWKYFAGRADSIKAQLWTTATWLISVQAGFLALLFSAGILEFAKASPIELAFCLPIPAFILCLFGVGISYYSLVVIDDASDHVTRNWTRSNRISHEFSSVDPYREKKGARIPVIACWILGIVFAVLALISAALFLIDVLEISSEFIANLRACAEPKSAS